MKYGFGVLAVCAAVAVTGCRPELAREKFGDDDAEWSARLKENYGGYQAPRTYAPALIDKYENLPEGQQTAPAPQAEDKANAAAVETPAVEEIPAVPAPVQEPEAKAQEAKTPVAPAPAPVQEPEVKDQAAKVPAAEPVKGEIYVVQSGDSLGKIAKKFYKDARRADLIFQVNRQVLKDANQLRPGMKLLIPPM